MGGAPAPAPAHSNSLVLREEDPIVFNSIVPLDPSIRQPRNPATGAPRGTAAGPPVFVTERCRRVPNAVPTRASRGTVRTVIAHAYPPPDLPEVERLHYRRLTEVSMKLGNGCWRGYMPNFTVYMFSIQTKATTTVSSRVWPPVCGVPAMLTATAAAPRRPE